MKLPWAGNEGIAFDQETAVVEVSSTESSFCSVHVPIMKNKKKTIFDLDRDGGREKINRALYSPQQYRREHAHVRTRRAWSLLLAVILGVVFGYLFLHGT
ncbi:hypothetical protein [Noviherbaspirillum sp.]|uniref:hypothetical protein n=1 Tax=Noviherbaspirillum sp. TaxID=1926288 RepID=UPI002FE1C8BD